MYATEGWGGGGWAWQGAEGPGTISIPRLAGLLCLLGGQHPRGLAQAYICLLRGPGSQECLAFHPHSSPWREPEKTLFELDHDSIRREVGWSTLSYFLAFCHHPPFHVSPLLWLSTAPKWHELDCASFPHAAGIVYKVCKMIPSDYSERADM